MKKIVFLVLAMVMTLAFATVAWANPSFYASRNYDFRNLDTIKVYEIANNIPTDRRAVTMPEEKMLSALYKGAQKQKLELLDVRSNDIDVKLKNENNVIRFAYLEVVVNDMSTTSRFVPGYWDTRTEYEDRVWYDKEGKKHVDRIPHTRDVWIPESWHTDVHIDLMYNLYDENNNVLAKCSDKRDRTDEDNPNGMLGRSATDFFKQLQKANKK